MKFCEQCGNKLPDTGLFCEQCGTKVPLIEESIEKEIVFFKGDLNEKIHTDTNSNNNEYTGGNISSKKSKKIPIFLTSLILVSGVIGGFFWLNQNPKLAFSGETSETTSVSTETKKNTEATIESQETTYSSSSESETVESSSVDTQESLMEIISEDPHDTSTFSIHKIEESVRPELGFLPNPTGFYFSEIGNDDAVYSYNGNEAIRSASIIKLFLLESFFTCVRNGEMNLGDTYTLQSFDKVGGTGVLSTYADGYEITHEELARLMIVESDNTAGNILINLLGGPKLVTQYIREKGYNQTSLGRLFMDSDAISNGYDNYTSAEDVGRLLENMYLEGNQNELNILRQTKNKQKLPYALGSDVAVYNKTGEYSDYGVENDGCIFEKNGIAYVVVFLSQDGNSQNQIAAMQNIGNNIYQEFLGGE